MEQNRPATRSLLRALALFLSFLALKPAQGEDPTNLDDLSGLLAEIRARHEVPGLVAATVVDGQVVALGAAGVRKQGTDVAITVDDKLHIGSCTKAMTAVLMATFVQEKTLDWNTTLAEAFPDLQETIHADYAPVTISQLLGHRAGLPANASWWQTVRGSDVVAQRENLVKGVLTKPPQRKPGTTFLYSNLSYVVAGAIAEKQTGKAWELLVQERVFVPLHILSAGFGPPSVDGELDQPWGHGKQLFQVAPLQLDNPPLLGPAGRVHLTIRDWARFVSLFLPDRQQAPLLLSAESLEHLQTPVAAVPGEHERNYALGWVVRQREDNMTTLSHAGSNTMWYAIVRAMPARRLAFLVVCNSGLPTASAACEEAFTEMLKRHEQK